MENRPLTATNRAVYQPPKLPAGAKRLRPQSANAAGPRARIETALKASVDERLEQALQGIAAGGSAPPPVQLTRPSGGHADTPLVVQGSGVAMAKQLREQNELLRQAHNYLHQQLSACMTRLRSVVAENTELTERTKHAEMLVQALTAAHLSKDAQLRAVAESCEDGRAAGGSEARFAVPSTSAPAGLSQEQAVTVLREIASRAAEAAALRGAAAADETPRPPRGDAAAAGYRHRGAAGGRGHRGRGHCGGQGGRGEQQRGEQRRGRGRGGRHRRRIPRRRRWRERRAAGRLAGSEPPRIAGAGLAPGERWWSSAASGGASRRCARRARRAPSARRRRPRRRRGLGGGPSAGLDGGGHGGGGRDGGAKSAHMSEAKACASTLVDLVCGPRRRRARRRRSGPTRPRRRRPRVAPRRVAPRRPGGDGGRGGGAGQGPREQPPVEATLDPPAAGRGDAQKESHQFGTDLVASLFKPA